VLQQDGSDCSTSSCNMGALLYFLSAWRATSHSPFCWIHATSHFLSHSQTTWVQNPVVLKARKNTWTSRDEMPAGRYLTRVTLWAHHWFWWKPLPYRNDDILFKRAGRWQDKQPVLSGKSFGSTALNKSLFISPCYFLYRCLPLHSCI